MEGNCSTAPRQQTRFDVVAGELGEGQSEMCNPETQEVAMFDDKAPSKKREKHSSLVAGEGGEGGRNPKPLIWSDTKPDDDSILCSKIG